MYKKKIQKIEELSNEVDKEISQFDILDVILDENNTEPIILEDDKGNRLSFEQVAVIPYNEKVYVILKPIDKIENIADDEAIVFFVDETVKPSMLRVEPDEAIAVKIFDEYYDLVEEANNPKKDTKKGKKEGK